MKGLNENDLTTVISALDEAIDSMKFRIKYCSSKQNKKIGKETLTKYQDLFNCLMK